MPPPPRRVKTATSKSVQEFLFDAGEDWQKEWRGMPECKSEDLLPWKSITVNFTNFDDMLEFAKLIGQKITPDTKWLWYPKAEIDRVKDLRYVDSEKQRSIYYEWKVGESSGNLYDCPRTLPADAEARVLAYEALTDLLNES